MKKQGQIRVTVQEADRLKAITQLSEAIVYLAKALSAVPQVVIEDCFIQTVKDGTGVYVDTSQDIMKTTIESLGEEQE